MNTKKLTYNPIYSIYKANIATQTINTGHELSSINNITLIKHIPHTGTKMNIWENLQIYIHKIHKQLIDEQIQTNTTLYSKY